MTAYHHAVFIHPQVLDLSPGGINFYKQETLANQALWQRPRPARWGRCPNCAAERDLNSECPYCMSKEGA